MEKTIFIVDIDKTMFENRQRSHLVPVDPSICVNWREWDLACESDTPIIRNIQMIEAIAETDMYQIQFLTSRCEVSEEPTLAMIEKYAPKCFERMTAIHMRAEWDNRHPVDMKRDKLMNLGVENIGLLIDDDKAICDMARQLGIDTIQVGHDKLSPTKEAIKANSAKIVQRALGSPFMKHLKVTPDLVLVDEYDSNNDRHMCHQVKIEANEDTNVSKLKDFKCHLQVDFRYENGQENYQMIFGEDNEDDINRANIFEYLFLSALEIEAIS